LLIKFSYFIYLLQENETSDSESVDVEVIDDLKKNKNKIPKTSDLDDSQIKKAQIITELREKYHCFSHQLPCIIRDGIHKKLTCAHLELWSTEIVSIYYKLIYFNLFF
jgi:hypothetical protein